MKTATVAFKQALHAIQQAERVLIVADMKPDGDTLGSSAAALNWLLREGKQVAVYSQAPIPHTFAYLDNVHHFTSDRAILTQPYDVILTFDTGSALRCGIEGCAAGWPPHHQVIVFDHHLSNQRFGHINLVFTDACSTAEVLYAFFEEHNIHIDERMATSLLTGIYTDTSFFSNSGTTSLGMQAAGKLVAQGARFQDILRHVIKNRSIEALKIWGLGFSRLTPHPTLDLVYTYFTLEDTKGLEAHSDAFEIMINFLNAACGEAKTILVIRELTHGSIKGSFRSISHNVAKVATLFGGGGHERASGFVVDGHLVVEQGKLRVVPA